ncbi:hypothetical protein BM43_7560 (plasmid) [Burkholderia gladioli]|uniref:Uncharacterized protein n=1 Tax=Burkholderia gladioli TaxID=28095 RepID=A0AAW3FCX3_BURGA|nr:hypothetical protein [Burkholderia gladioli]AJW93594.1 hypothetical protein BM43_7560 [Burkholderia gladioli]KGC24052.1 hypothetical protein DM48_8029 [Burkholderia gladioli]
MFCTSSAVVSREVKRLFQRIVWSLLALISILFAAGLFAQNGHAAPTQCSSGYQDNTCLTPVYHAPISAPMCPTDPGWITTGNAVWQGAHWSQPQCSYLSPPTCPTGLQQTVAPTWTGAQWTPPSCQQPILPPVDPISQCAQAIEQRQAGYGITDANAATDSPVLEENNTLRWHYWTADHYSDWKLTWTGVFASPKQQGNLFSFTSNGHFLVVKGTRWDGGVDPGSGTELQNFVAAVCEANPTTGAVISVQKESGFARCGGKQPEGSTGPCGGG